jgi:hypothetical protein
MALPPTSTYCLEVYSSLGSSTHSIFCGRETVGHAAAAVALQLAARRFPPQYMVVSYLLALTLWSAWRLFLEHQSSWIFTGFALVTTIALAAEADPKSLLYANSIGSIVSVLYAIVTCKLKQWQSP